MKITLDAIKELGGIKLWELQSPTSSDYFYLVDDNGNILGEGANPTVIQKGSATFIQFSHGSQLGKQIFVDSDYSLIRKEKGFNFTPYQVRETKGVASGVEKDQRGRQSVFNASGRHKEWPGEQGITSGSPRTMLAHMMTQALTAAVSTSDILEIKGDGTIIIKKANSYDQRYKAVIELIKSLKDKDYEVTYQSYEERKVKGKIVPAFTFEYDESGHPLFFVRDSDNRLTTLYINSNAPIIMTPVKIDELLARDEVRVVPVKDLIPERCYRVKTSPNGYTRFEGKLERNYFDEEQRRLVQKFEGEGGPSWFPDDWVFVEVRKKD